MSPEVDQTQLEYLDYNYILDKYSRILKEDHNCDLVIALNHMKVEEDLAMAQNNTSDKVDIILGGHDHIYLS